MCEVHMNEKSKKSRATNWCAGGCWHVEVKENGGFCPECIKHREHTKEGWKLSKEGFRWSCIQHTPPCKQNAICNIDICMERSVEICDGKKYCEFHADKFEHDKICEGPKDSHRGCRGPIPLTCKRCTKPNKVKFLYKTKEWLCKPCLRIQDLSHNKWGKFKMCTTYGCPNEARYVPDDSDQIRCPSHSPEFNRFFG
jgi:hypothetical protein